MGFFKKLFSSKQENGEKQDEVKVPDVFSETYFKKRYTEQDLYESPGLMDGTMKMLSSYYIDNKMTQKIQEPVNHPVNLDQIVNDGMGFHMYCKAFGLEDFKIGTILAMGFNDFLIKKYGFKLYKDSEPEFPLRAMTLKYNKNGSLLSLYPLEYTLKVLNNEALFEDLRTKIDKQIETLPTTEEVLNKYLDALGGSEAQ